MAITVGFEPTTSNLEDLRSIQLSYVTSIEGFGGVLFGLILRPYPSSPRDPTRRFIIALLEIRISGFPFFSGDSPPLRPPLSRLDERNLLLLLPVAVLAAIQRPCSGSASLNRTRLTRINNSVAHLVR